MHSQRQSAWHHRHSIRRIPGAPPPEGGHVDSVVPDCGYSEWPTDWQVGVNDGLVIVPDIGPEHAMAMILPRCSPGFFPRIEPFSNRGPASNGQPIRDRSRYTNVIDELK